MASHDFPVAVIGMAVKLPGANNCSEFWDLMVNQEDTVSTFPEERAADIEHILPTFKGQNARKQDTGSQKVADSSGQMEASSDSSTRDTSAISKTEIELNEDFNGQGKTKRDNSAISKTEIEVNEDFNGQGKTKRSQRQVSQKMCLRRCSSK
ncbi:uncharacterized protein LOC127873053 isoform X2 [Dreissena polymorpha]|uniref:uncharacterized protein LOC127873053 isoform X2 n=1 Tax=Dreissena polymorpha TaxID=45954 RepID=UPI00226554EA|nr:uncharacterized protein LOC127873053 isoform X2 [Dreissena polymorpha]